jgi:hypothetical protein
VCEGCADGAAYCETGYKLFLPTLILSFVPLVFHFFMVDYHLDERHNAVEDEIVCVPKKPEPRTDEPNGV